MENILKKLASSSFGVKLIFRLWPPLWFTGISISKASDDLREVEVQMKMRFYNKNIVGVHFGGNLFAMTDPIFMTMLMVNLGSDYVVWDSAGKIEFKKPGKGIVRAKFVLEQEDIDDILSKTKDGDKYFKVMPISILNENNEVISEVERTLYIRKKRQA